MHNDTHVKALEDLLGSLKDEKDVIEQRIASTTATLNMFLQTPIVANRATYTPSQLQSMKQIDAIIAFFRMSGNERMTGSDLGRLFMSNRIGNFKHLNSAQASLYTIMKRNPAVFKREADGTFSCYDAKIPAALQPSNGNGDTNAVYDEHSDPDMGITAFAGAYMPADTSYKGWAIDFAKRHKGLASITEVATEIRAAFPERDGERVRSATSTMFTSERGRKVFENVARGVYRLIK